MAAVHSRFNAFGEVSLKSKWSIRFMMERMVQWARVPLKLGFFKKITVHVVVMTVLTGLTITGTHAYRYRREMYALEIDTAYMVYSALSHYLTAHHQWYSVYIRRHIDFELQQQFMQLDPDVDHFLQHRPVQVTIYDELGRVRYDYRDNTDRPPAAPIAPDEVPRQTTLEYLRAQGLIRVSGPVDTRDAARGFLKVYIPTKLSQQMTQLWITAVQILLVVLAGTLLLSLVFSRQTLQPIRALTQAAKKVHRGDLDQQVPVFTDDEIGELTTTFNEMIFSLGRRLDVMHRMQEWTVRISRQLDADRLFDTLGEMFERMSTADAYRLYLYDTEGRKLAVRLEYGAAALPPPERDELAQLAMRERWTIYLKSNGSANNEPVDVAELAIPLLSGKHSVGVIRIGRKQDKGLYDDDTLTILQTLAQHASVAIDNANLYQRLAAQERMAQEMTLARQIQQSMLPRAAPSLPGYAIAGGSQPALEVGGDYFDYVQRNGYCYLLVGDVSGKGVPAALIMSIIRALIHTYLEFEAAPVDVLRRVNRNISSNLDPDMFVTMSAVELDMAHHAIRFGRAGHEPLLVVHADGTVQQITPPGAALGMLDAATFDDIMVEASYTLQPGDTVVLYTDGITEAQSATEEEFGYERLQAFVREQRGLAVPDLYEAIRAEVRRFAEGRDQLDDITLVVLRWLG